MLELAYRQAWDNPKTRLAPALEIYRTTADLALKHCSAK